MLDRSQSNICLYIYIYILGTFLYVGLCEIMAHEFDHDEGAFKRWTKFISLLAGFTLLTCVTLIA